MFVIAFQPVCYPLFSHPYQVGGGKGHISTLLGQAYPKLNFIVQDLDSVVQLGKDSVPADLLPRFNFMPYNFLYPQPDLRGRVKGRITYFLRSILHDWSNKYCVQILKNIVDVLEEVCQSSHICSHYRANIQSQQRPVSSQFSCLIWPKRIWNKTRRETLILMLAQGGRILINDQVLPPKGAVNSYLDKLSQ